MTTATLFAWARTASDTRDTASRFVRLEVPQRHALAAATLIEMNGMSIGGHRLPPGHGVQIAYASGRRRLVRRDDVLDTHNKLSEPDTDDSLSHVRLVNP